MDLDLAACPICRARRNFARGTTEIEGRSRVTYECVECGSVLMRLGDDLWMEGDRWAYQRVGRADAAFLLHRPLTVGELQWLAASDRQPLAVSDQPLATSTEPSTTSHQPPAADRPPLVISHQSVYSTVPAGEREAQGRRGAVPAAGPLPPTAMARPRSSASAPLLTNSMLLILLCLVMYVTAMIAVKGLGDRKPPEATPVAATLPAAPLLTRVPLVTQTPLPAGIPLAAETSPLTDTPLPAGTLSITETLLLAETPSVAGTPLATETLPPPDSPLATASASTDVRLQGVTDYQAPTGIYYVLGEVVNTTGENLGSIEISVSFYDAGGQQLATGSTFSELSIVEAADTAPFKLAVPPPVPPFATYEAQVDYERTGEDLLRLEVLSHSAYTDENGRYHIAGQVRNPHSAAVKLPKIVATYYNAAGQVVRVEAVYGQVPSLQPDGVLPFEVVLADPPADLDHYALQTEAVWDKSAG